MAKRRHTVEQIIGKPREAEVQLGQGVTVGDDCRLLGVLLLDRLLRHEGDVRLTRGGADRRLAVDQPTGTFGVEAQDPVPDHLKPDPIVATAVVRYTRRKPTTVSIWANRLLERKPARLVTVVVANKMDRIAWAVMTREESYRPAPVEA